MARAFPCPVTNAFRFAAHGPKGIAHRQPMWAEFLLRSGKRRRTLSTSGGARAGPTLTSGLLHGGSGSVIAVRRVALLRVATTRIGPVTEHGPAVVFYCLPVGVTPGPRSAR